MDLFKYNTITNYQELDTIKIHRKFYEDNKDMLKILYKNLIIPYCYEKKISIDNITFQRFCSLAFVFTDY